MITDTNVDDVWVAFPWHRDADLPSHYLVVKYKDGSGQVILPNGHLMFVNGTSFEDEPSGFLDPHHYQVM
jgi:hypothetical protein